MGHTAWGSIATAIALVGGGLLVPAGIAKLVAPDTVRAATNLPGLANSIIVRLVGAGELLLAAAVLVVGHAWSTAALAVAYLAFAVVATTQRRRGADCGCFGATHAPTGWSHVGIDLGIAVDRCDVGRVVSFAGGRESPRR